MRWDDDRWRMHDGVAGHGADWILFTLLLVLVIGLMVALAVVLLRGSTPAAKRDATTESEADRILRRRFATGEIDEEEFRRRQGALADHPR